MSVKSYFKSPYPGLLWWKIFQRKDSIESFLWKWRQIWVWSLCSTYWTKFSEFRKHTCVRQNVNLLEKLGNQTIKLRSKNSFTITYHFQLKILLGKCNLKYLTIEGVTFPNIHNILSDLDEVLLIKVSIENKSDF